MFKLSGFCCMAELVQFLALCLPTESLPANFFFGCMPRSCVFLPVWYASAAVGGPKKP